MLIESMKCKKVVAAIGLGRGKKGIIQREETVERDSDLMGRKLPSLISNHHVCSTCLVIGFNGNGNFNGNFNTVPAGFCNLG